MLLSLRHDFICRFVLKADNKFESNPTFKLQRIKKKKNYFINPLGGDSICSLHCTVYTHTHTHTHTGPKYRHAHTRPADMGEMLEWWGCHTAAPRSSLGVRCLAQWPRQFPGGEPAPLQQPVHNPYCGPCWTTSFFHGKNVRNIQLRNCACEILAFSGYILVGNYVTVYGPDFITLQQRWGIIILLFQINQLTNCLHF